MSHCRETLQPNLLIHSLAQLPPPLPPHLLLPITHHRSTHYYCLLHLKIYVTQPPLPSLSLTSQFPKLPPCMCSTTVSKTLPAAGVGGGLCTLNSLRLQTTVPMVCPRIHIHASQLPKPYLIATNPSKPLSCGSCRKQIIFFQGFHNRGNSPKPSVRLLVQQQHQSTTATLKAINGNSRNANLQYFFFLFAKN